MSLPEKNPWPGLLPYNEADASLFRGRNGEIANLFELVQGDTLSVLYGVSGLGKTSLLRAGLAPKLQAEQYRPVFLRVRFAKNEFGTRLCLESRPAVERYRQAAGDGIEIRVARHEGLRPGEDRWDWLEWFSFEILQEHTAARPTLWEMFHNADHRLWTADNHPVTPVLILDQFEEIFTLGQQTPEHAGAVEAFLAELSDLLANRPPPRVLETIERGDRNPYDPHQVPLRVLLTLREDFLPQLSQLRDRGFPTIRRREMRMEPLRPAAAREVIEQPAPGICAAGFSDALLRFLAGTTDDPGPDAAIEPALLSVVLHELVEKARSAGHAQLLPELLLGSRDTILEEFYEGAFKGIDPAMRTFVERELITPGGFRDTRAVDDAISREGVTQAALDTLVDRRLLRYEDRAQGQRRIELTHDLLARVARDAKRKRDEAAAAVEVAEGKSRERQERRRRWLTRARLYGLPVVIALTVSIGTPEAEARLFLVGYAALCLGMLHGVLMEVRGSFFKLVQAALSLTLAQGFILYCIIRLVGVGIDGSISWQCVMLLGICIGSVSLGRLIRVLIELPADSVIFACFLQFLLLLTSGYLIKRTEMSRGFRMIASVTPLYAAQVIADSSFVLNRPLVGDFVGDHFQAIRNLGAGDIDNRTDDGLFVNTRPAKIGVVTLYSYGFLFLLVHALERRQRDEPMAAPSAR